MLQVSKTRLMSETSASRTRLMWQFQLPVRDRCQVFSVQAGTKSRVGGAWGLRPPTISKLRTLLLASTGPSACNQPVGRASPATEIIAFYSKSQITPKRNIQDQQAPSLACKHRPVGLLIVNWPVGNSNYSFLPLQILENAKYK